MTLKSLIVVLSCIVLLGASPNEESFTWNENRKLTWADFKGSVDPNSDAVALTASGITFGYSINRTNKRITGFKATIESHFYPYKSWYVRGKADDYILGHEQLHFDITELYARKFREQVARLKVSQNVKQQLDVLYANINKALAETQNAYDTQSAHSMDPEMQKKWDQRIKEELKLLDRYKSQ